MKLHTDKKVFEQAVEAAAQYCGVPVTNPSRTL